MTNREFFESVKNGNITEDVKAHAAAAITKLDEQADKRKGKAAEKTSAENAPIIAALLAECKAAPDTAKPASMLATAVGVSTAKASSLLVKLATEGRLVQTEGKAGTGKGKVKFYRYNADCPANADDEGENVTEDEGGED